MSIVKEEHSLNTTYILVKFLLLKEDKINIVKEKEIKECKFHISYISVLNDSKSIDVSEE